MVPQSHKLETFTTLDSAGKPAIRTVLTRGALAVRKWNILFVLWVSRKQVIN